MARSTRLPIGMRSAPTTEMYTRCAAPARDAARTRIRALSSSPLGVAGEVHDGPGPVHRGFDSVAGVQVAGYELDAVGTFMVAAEHPYVTTGVSQPRDDEASERTGAAGDQDGRCHAFPPE